MQHDTPGRQKHRFNLRAGIHNYLFFHQIVLIFLKCILNLMSSITSFFARFFVYLRVSCNDNCIVGVSLKFRLNLWIIKTRLHASSLKYALGQKAKNGNNLSGEKLRSFNTLKRQHEIVSLPSPKSWSTTVVGCFIFFLRISSKFINNRNIFDKPLARVLISWPASSSYVYTYIIYIYVIL